MLVPICIDANEHPRLPTVRLPADEDELILPDHAGVTDLIMSRHTHRIHLLRMPVRATRELRQQAEYEEPDSIFQPTPPMG